MKFPTTPCILYIPKTECIGIVLGHCKQRCVSTTITNSKKETVIVNHQNGTRPEHCTEHVKVHTEHPSCLILAKLILRFKFLKCVCCMQAKTTLSHFRKVWPLIYPNLKSESIPKTKQENTPQFHCLVLFLARAWRQDRVKGCPVHYLWILLFTVSARCFSIDPKKWRLTAP